MSKQPPYPGDTRSKGWRYEYDYEKIEQTVRWAMAAEIPMAQHAMLMMELVAWKQVPCGSLPNDADVIRAMCKVPPGKWRSMQPVLMCGWWLAADGRLYHDTIAARVLEMLMWRRNEAERRNRNRGKPPGVPEVSRGTTVGHAPGHTRDSHGTPDTGTGTTSSLRSEEILSPKYPVDFELAWEAYPKRPGASKAAASKAWSSRVKDGTEPGTLLGGVKRYAAYCCAERIGPQFIKQPATFFGPDEHYLADWTPSAPGPRVDASGNRFTAAAAGIFPTLNHSEVIDV